MPPQPPAPRIKAASRPRRIAATLPTTPKKTRIAELLSALVALQAVVRFLKKLETSPEVLKALKVAVQSLEKELRSLR